LCQLGLWSAGGAAIEGDGVETVDALAERLRRLEDLLAIQDLLAEYVRCVDRADFDRYASLFAEDGEVDLSPHGQARGRDAIRTLIAGMTGPPGGSFRIIGRPEIDLRGDEATAVTLFAVIGRTGEGGPAVTTVGHHHDELRREGGRWCFARRRAVVALPAG
jgi:uncharacterized protein (TIGR02246 family)